MDWQGYTPPKMTEYKLTPSGKAVLSILLRQQSGYGREQVLLVALRLACKDLVEAYDRLRVVETERQPRAANEGAQMIDFLLMAEASLKDDPDA